MSLEFATDAAALTLPTELAALALGRMANRLVDPVVIKITGVERNSSFLDQHRLAMGSYALDAVQRACLAVEFALGEEDHWQRISAAAPPDRAESLRNQILGLRRVFLEAMPVSDASIAKCLGEFRRGPLASADLDEEELFARLASLQLGLPESESADDAPALATLAAELSNAGRAPLAELLRCRSRYGEPLFIGLTDYFLCRALQADAKLGHEFAFVHLEQASELWKDDLSVLADAVEQQSATMAAALDGASDATEEYGTTTGAEDELERHFQQGLDRYVAADFEGAIPHFTAALRIDPESCPLYAYRGDAYRLLCEYDRAIADYSAALRLNPASAPVLAQRAAAHRLKGDLPQAIVDATAALALDPRHATAYTCRADAQLAQGELDAAIADYSAAIDLQPPTAWAQLGRGTAHLRKGNYDAAIDDFSRVLAVDPHQVSAQQQRGDACRLKGELARAIVDYTAVLRHHPRNALAYRNRALAHELNGDAARAIFDYSRALRVDPADAAARCSRGVLFRRHGKLARAQEDLDEALRRAPNNETALYHRARLALARGQFQAALADLDATLDRNPNHIPSYLVRALTHDRLREFSKGIQNCGRALLLDKRCAAAWLIRGMIGSHAGNYTQAGADLSEAIALDAKFPLAHQERGTVNVLAGDLEAACADYTRLIELCPRNAVAYANRGIVHQLRGDHEAALGDFGHALRLDPKCMLAGSHLFLSESARDKTTWLLADYAEGIRPTPRRAPTTHVTARLVSAPAADDKLDAAAPAPPADARSDAATTIVPIVRSQATRTQIRINAPETLTDIAAAVPTQPEMPVPAQARTAAPKPAAAEEKAAEELLTLDEPSEPAEAETPSAPAAPPAPSLPPLQCPLCREVAVPSERLDAGRVRCGNCKAVFMPTAASFLAAAPKEATENARTLLKKIKNTRPAGRSNDDDRPRFTLRQKLIGVAAAALILLVVGYFFFPSFGGGGTQAATTTVGADQLLRDFTVDKVNAAKKYTLGYVVVSGEVAEVYRDKRPRVRFKGEEKAKGFVEAVFTHPNDLKEIEKGNKLTVRGECEGWQKNIVEITLCKAVERSATSQ